MEEKTPLARDDIELLPLRHGDQQMVQVRDPLGLIKKPIVLNETALAVLSMLDGTHTISDLQLFLTRTQGGVLVTTDDVRRVLDQLSNAFLLQDERFVKARAQMVADYAAEPIRHAFHAGIEYPATAGELSNMLDQILVTAEQEADSGKPSRDVGPNWPPIETTTFPQEDILALTAPHMEIDASAHCYGAAYRQIAGDPVDLVFILGTGHNLKSRTFCLTKKDFETPLGTALTDKEIVGELMSSAPGCVLDNDMAHRHEHSVEFEVVFLQHALKNPSVHIVPILCGSFRSELNARGRASEIPCVGDFLKRLRSIIERETEQHKRRCLVVTGVDFSHIGLKFGDKFTGRTLLEETMEYDRALIENLCRWDANGFWQTAKNVNDTYKVCGFAPLASLLEMFGSAKGHLLAYDVWHEDATHSAVSFASLVFTKK